MEFPRYLSRRSCASREVPLLAVSHGKTPRFGHRFCLISQTVVFMLPASLVRGPGVAGERAGGGAGSSSRGLGEADCWDAAASAAAGLHPAGRPWGCSNALEHRPRECVTCFCTAISLSPRSGWAERPEQTAWKSRAVVSCVKHVFDEELAVKSTAEVFNKRLIKCIVARSINHSVTFI